MTRLLLLRWYHLFHFVIWLAKDWRINVVQFMWNIQFQIVMHPTFFLNTYKYRSIPLIFPQPDQWLSDCTANIWWHQFDECAHKLKSRWCCEAVTLFSSYVNMPHVPLSAELFAFVWSKLIFGGVVNYCASKHGIENATYSLLLALFGKRGRHTVNCIVFFFWRVGGFYTTISKLICNENTIKVSACLLFNIGLFGIWFGVFNHLFHIVR